MYRKIQESIRIYKLLSWRLAVFLLVCAAALAALFVASSFAGTPDSGTISPTSTSTTWQGQHYTAAAYVVGQVTAACPPASLDPQNLVCDHFKVTVQATAAYWADKLGGAQITIRWADASNDFDMYVYDSTGALVKSSTQGSTTFEQVLVPDAVGDYEVRVAPFTVVDSGFQGVADFVSKTISATPGAGPSAYHGLVISGDNPATAPKNTAVALKKKDIPIYRFTDTGFEAAEPTIGVRKNGTAFYAAATFDGVLETAHTKEIRSKDGGLTWQVVQPTLAGQVDTHPETLDPYTYVEEDSGRVFDIDLYGENLAVGLPLGAFLSWSDDEGATWMTSTVSIPGLNDHQTLFAGPTPIGNPLLKSVDPRFPEVLYYCVNQVADSWCARSINGGLTFTMGATPAYLGADPETNDVVCGGLHGHLATDSAGRLFLPKGHCGDPWLAISEDGGDNWTRIQISNKIRAADTQMAIAVDSADNLYYVWFDDIHHLPYLSISRDHGATWSAPRMIGPPGVYEVNFPTIAAGDPGKIALTFPGTAVNDQSDPSRPWNSYVVISTDALSSDPTFVSNISNPANDPVYRGACLGRCGRMFDFLDVVISPNDGSVWATAVDTCTAKSGCPTNPKASSDDMRGIAIRQISGPPLIGTGACPGKANKCR